MGRSQKRRLDSILQGSERPRQGAVFPPLLGLLALLSAPLLLAGSDPLFAARTSDKSLVFSMLLSKQLYTMA